MKHFFIFLSLLSISVIAFAQPKNNTLRQSLTSQPLTGAPSAPQTESAGKMAQKLTPGSVERNDSLKDTSAKIPLGYKGDPKEVIRIALLLPLNAQNSLDKLYASMSDKEGAKADNSNLKQTVQEALDFYEGLRFALSKDTFKQKIALYIFDTENNDSLVQELVKDDTLKACDIIIGPTTGNQAKTVAAFCKKNRIINIQPFVASKSFASENPFLIRFMPTLDAHLQKEYEMVIDSFSDDNIIVYTTKKERDLSAARQLDTLFKSYNAINAHKLKYTFVNSGDSSMPTAKRSISAHILPNMRNVVMMTCFDEPVVNSQLRSFKDKVVIFGMPNWIDAEQIRADYLSKSEPYFTDNFHADTTNAVVAAFINSYEEANNQKPSHYSYLGYDAMRYLTIIFDKYGKNFKLGFDNESYEGLGFGFHISPMIRLSKETGTPVINYYSNTAMHLFQVSDYKVWLVK